MIRTLALACLLCATSAHAQMGATMMQMQMACFPEKLLDAGLLKVAGEERVLQGVTKIGSRLVVYSTPDGGTWTAVIILDTGMSCTLASGRTLELRHVKDLGEPS